MSSTPFDPRLKRLERLLEVSRQASSFRELYPLLQSLVDVACELTDSQASSILLYEADTGLLKFVAAPRAKEGMLQHIRVPVEKSVAGLVFAQSRPLVIQYAQYDPRVYRGVDYTLDFETDSILAVPLIFKEQTIGVFEAVNKRGDAHYTEEDVIILETLASQAALVIQNIKLSEETQRAHNELTELSRMKADFVAVASHELRTPLGLVLGHTTQLLEHITDSEDRQQLDAVLRGAERLKKIIEDLEKVQLVPQEPTNLRRSKFALEQLVQEVVASFQDFADRKHIALQTQLPKMALTIEGDAEKIGIALSNLVKNAITFTNEGGRVLIAAERIPGYVKVSVIDNGIGIPAKDLHRVFERFFQVQSHMTRRHGGMGLGLSVAKVMIEMHGGQIWVESVEGKGSNFSFLLPISTVQADAARKVFQT